MLKLSMEEQKQVMGGLYRACIFRKSDDSLVKDSYWTKEEDAYRWVERNCNQRTQYGFVYED